MNSQELKIPQSGLNPEIREIIIASLNEIGFEAFLDESDFLLAYIQDESVNDTLNERIRSVFASLNISSGFSVNNIPYKNWNSEWEKNFNPVIIDNQCAVKASFHNIPELRYNIIINPQMSFGTGHHETTRMMIKHTLDTDFTDMDVLDMGCGTGILGILAAMKGAKSITAIDNDLQAVSNAIENFSKNNINTPFQVLHGDANLLLTDSYNIILANINRNIILNDLNSYYIALRKPGTLILSGILGSDKQIITEACIKSGLKILEVSTDNQWISIILAK